MSWINLKQAGEHLLAAESVIIITHLRPDGDALGSTFGMRAFLRGLGKKADVLLPEPPPRRYREWCQGYLSRLDEIGFQAYALVLLLDCANVQRLGSAGVSVEFLRTLNFLSIDHHPANSIAARYDCLIPAACSASEIVATLALASGRPLPVESASRWLAGMMTDTGCFRFSNTDGDALRVAAQLLDHGAELENVVNTLFFSKSMRQLQFEAELVEKQLRLACHGRLAYAFIPDDMLERHHFALREDEGLIDILRGIDSVIIAMLLHRQPDGFKVSLRSKDQRYPVGPLARSYGGGGHDMAAGITLNLDSLEEVENIMLGEIGKLLGFS